MECFLVRLSHAPAAWPHIVEHTTSLDERMEPVQKPISAVGGPLPSFRFLVTERFEGGAPAYAVPGGFAIWGGHDIPAVEAFPSQEDAHAFNMVGSVEAGPKVMCPTAIMPQVEAGEAVAMVTAVLARTGCAAPGWPEP